MNISPQKSIPVSYVVLPTDPTTYYVQAVLRDTTSSKTLQTINLTQNASVPYRYEGEFDPVSDPSGLGRYIDITVIPYTDSGHTTPSQNYAALLLNYVVLQPWLPTLGAGAGAAGNHDKLIGDFNDLLEEKLYGTREDLKKGFLFSKPKIRYSRIAEHVRAATGAIKDEILAEHGISMQEVREILGNISSILSSHGDKVGEIVSRLDMLEARVEDSRTESQEIGESSRQEMLQEIAKTRSELKNLHIESSNNLGRMVDERSKESLEGVKRHLQDSFSGKQVWLSLGRDASEKAPQSSRYAPHEDKDIMRLIS